MAIKYMHVLASACNNHKFVKSIYNVARRNKDGSDKIVCFYYKYRNKHVEMDDIEHLYLECLWEAILKWSHPRNRKIDKFQSKFINYVWINVRNRFLDNHYYPFFGDKRKLSQETIDLKVNFHNNKIHIEEVELEDKTICNYDYTDRLEKVINILHGNKYSWSEIINLTMEGLNIYEISKALKKKKKVVEKEMNKIIILFDNLNTLT